jgi:hypothetical protein
MRCPLPIDWLEYLEGAHSEELASHLPGCLPCQLLVEELRREGRPQLRLSRLPKSEAWPRWIEAEPASPAFGDIRWTGDSLRTTSTLVTRVQVLVMSDVWEEKGGSWCEVVPLLTDIENATSLDLVLVRSENTMEVPWRVPLRHQTIANIGDLGARIGCLTEPGRAIVQKLLEGYAPEERFGSPIEGPDDLRVRLTEEVGSVIRRLGQPYSLILEPADVQTTPPRVLSFELRPFMVSEPATGALELAADSAVKEEEHEWVAEIPNRGALKGRVEYRYAEDELLFVIEQVAETEMGLHSPAWIALWSRRLSEPVTSAQFVPSVGGRVSIGRDLGVLPREISRLELRLSDEG